MVLSKILISKFIKDYKDIENPKVRDKYGYLGGTIGILTNILLAGAKFIIGRLSNSISLIADAMNNLSDATSSVITIVGFKLSSKPADEEHPFGHGRIEYISGLLISFIVLYIGVEFVKSSYERIINPAKTEFQWIYLVVLLFSIAIKIWISKFNKTIAKSINSSALQASSIEAFVDVIISTCIIFSLILSRYTSLVIDGYIGLLVSAFILYSGYILIKDTLNPLLGEAPDPELVKNIASKVKKYEYIKGVHELVIHNYGPRKILASIHAEVPKDVSLKEIHRIVDKAEKEISEDLNIHLIIHLEPVE
ncbi:cation transporter [Clostridium carboxidivorans P7]|uniref:Cation diffusion facilitator family transporter n=1 Tax=Clostridium carboxidivorans P7 TaxID=536227 RepID=C6PX06_9CLOT|nr:cation diffusion facilitator family transporter [Clostridium carboxidivorans]AKN30093.1 cation transporter [Clostridium carboxidivorans P7]EET86243.1 cation diffusion facilitator family transporter [Clostridium carboxidivorans P7]EFG86440.1 cation diffusion facilitator family transporter [Clostridium carboxidivorans P7]